MYEIRPSDITLPPTVSIDLSHLVVEAVEAATSTMDRLELLGVPPPGS
jgi:hypothetical protein